ncbi:hypothetical protein HY57_19030 [Dyella japonica A8]|uniref:Uncharacterized protein n=1 Tax=Dyella japonica A8 TaxID=1217721 RepID=A0A075KAE9_9GAMM|nr:hypothetical protein HY57_19030 [Dyella japonica A8]
MSAGLFLHRSLPLTVIPAKAGIQCLSLFPRLTAESRWIPAFAGMTGRKGGCKTASEGTP